MRLLNFILFNGFLQIVSYFKLVKLDKSIDMRLLFVKLRSVRFVSLVKHISSNLFDIKLRLVSYLRLLKSIEVNLFYYKSRSTNEEGS